MLLTILRLRYGSAVSSNSTLVVVKCRYVLLCYLVNNCSSDSAVQINEGADVVRIVGAVSKTSGKTSLGWC